jgi:uncharacterized protein (TIGR04255 family)
MTPERYVTYRKAPVSEVVLGVQFSQPVVDLDVLASFAAAVRGAYPGRAYHEPLPPIVERFDVASGVNLQFMFNPGGRLPRVWFTSEDDRRIVQLQADRLIFNWRRLALGEDYPRYDRLREALDDHLRTLRAVVADVRPTLAPLVVNHAEVTYINEVDIPGSRPGGEHFGLDRILRDLTTHDGSFLPRPEDATWQARYRIPSPTQDEPAGRLYVSAQPGYRTADQMPIYTLKLTANLVSEMLDDAAVGRALETGHEWAVRGFDDLVSEEMQDLWQKETP